MKKLLMTLIPLLFFAGCDLFEDDIVVGKITPEVSISVSKNTYSSTDVLKVTATVSQGGDSEGISYSWKIDNESEVGGTSEMSYGPFSDNSAHVIISTVTINGDVYRDTLRIKSEYLVEYGTPVENHGRLKIVGTDICDEFGTPVQLRGMSTHGLQYYYRSYKDNETMVKALAEDWGADIIRLSMYANEGGYIPNNGSDNRPTFKALIDQMIGYAEKYGLYAMIDWHMLSPGDPNIDADHAEEFFTYMANKHGSKKNVIFEICNEPNNMGAYDDDWNHDPLPYKVTWSEYLKPYAERIIPVIRAKSENLVVVGTPEYASQPNAVIGDPLDADNVIYTMHFYAGSHGSSYQNNVKKAIDAGIPVFVTEFGTQEASGDGENDWGSSDSWMTFMNDNNISWCNWNMSDDSRSGAVYENDMWPDDNQAAYSDPAYLKASGEWILDKIKNR